jgi:mannonate dehydratase
MSPRLPRRSFIHAAGTFALAPALVKAAPREWPPSEATDTPKLCLGVGANASEKEMRGLRQIGVDHVLMGGPAIPWTEADLRALVERFRAAGLTVANLMVGGFPNTLCTADPGATRRSTS